MKEHPIMFSGPMVKAIIEGRKTMTRRVIDPVKFGAPSGCKKVAPCYTGTEWPLAFYWQMGGCWNNSRRIVCPRPGERLWVRETWAPHLCADSDTERIHYRADGDSCPKDGELIRRWRPAIHMPRWASRITLEVKSVRVERLQEITESDAKAEGAPWLLIGGTGNPVVISGITPHGHRAGFAQLWDSFGGWTWFDNPWVSVIAFTKIL